jgi:hypothetical protein
MVLGALSTRVAITLSTVAWPVTFVILALLMFTGTYAFSRGCYSDPKLYKCASEVSKPLIV